MSGKIKVRTHPNSSQEKVKETLDGLEVWLKEKPIDGKANDSLVKILKHHFQNEVKIISGFSSRNKIIEIV